MDEGEKPFGIELIVILLIVAVINDVAEILFDILDCTGVGLAGEGIMEPINLVLDAFFTGVFVWKTGFGSESIVQLIDDFLQLIFIPGRTISVAAGIWIANHPKSIVGKVASEAAMIEGEGVGGEAEALTSETAQETERIEEAAREESQAEARRESSSQAEGGKAPSNRGDRASEAQSGEEENESADQQEVNEEDVMAAREEKNPMENLQQDLYESAEEEKPPRETPDSKDSQSEDRDRTA
jgi:hypothetical protein